MWLEFRHKRIASCLAILDYMNEKVRFWILCLKKSLRRVREDVFQTAEQVVMSIGKSKNLFVEGILWLYNF